MIELSGLFQAFAVLQRETYVPVWGRTEPESLIRVCCGEVSGRGAANAEGAFIVRIPPMSASENRTLTVENLTTGEVRTVSDIAVGEVILAGGQSNMEWTLELLQHSVEEALPDGDLKSIRFFTVPHTIASTPRNTVAGRWQQAVASEVLSFSGSAFYCARKLHADLGVPVGVVSSNWGGTVAETWLSREALALDPMLAPVLQQYESLLAKESSYVKLSGYDLNHPSSGVTEMQLDDIPVDPGNVGESQGFASPDFDDRAWGKIDLPGSWRRKGWDYNGVFWFRCEVTLPASAIDKDLTLVLGSVDKTDVTYFNGEVVGATGGDRDVSVWNEIRRYPVPKHLVHPGRNVIAVRAVSFIYDGAFGGAPGGMRLEWDDHSVPIDGLWRCMTEHDYGTVSVTRQDVPFGVNAPHALFDSMIAPLIPCAFRSVIWYQGESNASSRNQAYLRLMKALIGDWRHRFGQMFSFIQVQLANYGNPVAYDDASPWARIREAQLRLVDALPKVGCAVAVDVGEGDQIHPRDKRTVGERLAAWILHLDFGKTEEYTGPVCDRACVEGGRIRLYFSHTTGGLVARDGALRCFAVASESGRFIEADAVIDGNTVVVSSESVPSPLRVRYAWADNPKGANLYNGAMFAASPFETGGLHG